MEIWADILGFDGWYQISNQGRVRSCVAPGGGWGNRYRKGQPWRIIKCEISYRGSVQVCLHKKGEGKRLRFIVSRLMWICFNGPIPIGLEIDHKDRNSLNNCLENLRLATRSQNCRNTKSNSGKKYKGINLDKRMKEGSRRWNAFIIVNKKSIYLGAFYAEDEAAKAYNTAAIKYSGEFANLNAIPGGVH